MLSHNLSCHVIIADIYQVIFADNSNIGILFLNLFYRGSLLNNLLSWL